MKKYYRVPQLPEISSIVDEVKLNGGFKTDSKAICWIIKYYNTLCEEDYDVELK